MTKNVNVNVNEKKVAVVKEWKANEKQVAFMKVLKDFAKPVSLKEIEVVKGVKFATGTINTLVSRGLVVTVDTELEYTEMFMGVVVGTRKVNVKAYALA